MRRHPRSLAALAAATAALATIGFTATGASANAAHGAAAGTAHAGSGGRLAFGLPRHVLAPYYETYDTSTDLAAQSRASGARFLSLAFLETAQAGSCTAYWNGDTTEPISS
ncbi:MAG: hypothetical protein ACRDOB_25245, partial [Streptosporangiaceae bacterium]